MSSQTQHISILDTLRSLWSLLNKNYKRVIEYLCWMAKNFQNVFPCLETIADGCEISKRTAQNILSKLAGWGFIGWKRRPYQSNAYFIADELLKIDFKNKKHLFHRSQVNCHISCHVLDVVPPSEDSYVQTTVKKAPPEQPKSNVPINPEKEQQQRDIWYHSLPMSLRGDLMQKIFDYKNFGWLLKKLTESNIAEIKRNYSWYSRQNKVDNPAALFVKLAMTELKYAY